MQPGPFTSRGGLSLFVQLLRYAMKCLDKKRIKMKQGETLALNERIMLSLVSTGVSTWSSGQVAVQGETRRSPSRWPLAGKLRPF